MVMVNDQGTGEKSITDLEYLFMNIKSDLFQKTIRAVNNFSEAVKLFYSFADTRYDGLGVCYRSYVAWFAKKNMLRKGTQKYSQNLAKNIPEIFHRKTTRATKAPRRFRGWMGGR